MIAIWDLKILDDVSQNVKFRIIKFAEDKMLE